MQAFKLVPGPKSARKWIIDPRTIVVFAKVPVEILSGVQIIVRARRVAGDLNAEGVIGVQLRHTPKGISEKAHTAVAVVAVPMGGRLTQRRNHRGADQIMPVGVVDGRA